MARKFIYSITTSASAPLGRITAVSLDNLAASDLPSTAVTPGSYTNTDLTVDAQGRITAASNGSGSGGTVTSVTVTTANGVQVSAGTTQTITGSGTFALTLPYTISGSGSLANSGTSSLTGFTGAGTSSGTNTGDQTTISGNAGTATALATARAIYGNNFDGTAALTQVIASTYGGTGNGFTKFTGPATSEKTFTLPNASATVLTDSAAVTVAQGGTGLTTLTANNVILGNGTSTPTFVAPSTSGNVLTSNGTTWQSTAPNPTTVGTGAGLRGVIDALTLSWVSTTSFGITAGMARDSTDAITIPLPASLTKTTAIWSAGTANGALDASAVTANNWYHVFIIYKAATATSDILISLSPTAPTLPSGYGYFRRIGSLLTNASSQFIKFWQYHDDFVWDVPANDVNAAANPGTSAVTRTLSVPSGVKVKALMFVWTDGANGSASDSQTVYFSSLDTTDTAANVTVGSTYIFYSGAGVEIGAGGQVSCWTNTSSQVRSRLQASNASTYLYVGTIGWTDPRGRNA